MLHGVQTTYCNNQIYLTATKHVSGYLNITAIKFQRKSYFILCRFLVFFFFRFFFAGRLFALRRWRLYKFTQRPHNRQLIDFLQRNILFIITVATIFFTGVRSQLFPFVTDREVYMIAYSKTWGYTSVSARCHILFRCSTSFWYFFQLCQKYSTNTARVYTLSGNRTELQTKPIDLSRMQIAIDFVLLE